MKNSILIKFTKIRIRFWCCCFMSSTYDTTNGWLVSYFLCLLCVLKAVPITCYAFIISSSIRARLWHWKQWSESVNWLFKPRSRKEINETTVKYERYIRQWEFLSFSDFFSPKIFLFFIYVVYFIWIYLFLKIPWAQVSISANKLEIDA